MRDLVFSGATISEAAASAASALGLEAGNLRYVVMEAGSPALGRRSAVPARIAVLAEKPGAPRNEAPATVANPMVLLRARLAEVQETLGRALAEEVHFELAGDEEDVEIRVVVPARSTLAGDEIGAAPQALDHLLRRIALHVADAPRILVSNDAYRSRRESDLHATAHDLATAVLRDGVPRTMERLNSYERRLVHMALAEIPGVRTRSEGAGDTRRLLVEPASGEPTPAE
jgi:predicted RNA-binding protein Jag